GVFEDPASWPEVGHDPVAGGTTGGTGDTGSVVPAVGGEQLADRVEGEDCGDGDERDRGEDRGAKPLGDRGSEAVGDGVDGAGGEQDEHGHDRDDPADPARSGGADPGKEDRTE